MRVGHAMNTLHSSGIARHYLTHQRQPKYFSALFLWWRRPEQGCGSYEEGL
jgi:hypothetical protein